MVIAAASRCSKSWSSLPCAAMPAEQALAALQVEAGAAVGGDVRAAGRKACSNRPTSSSPCIIPAGRTVGRTVE
ncbi:MAG: hypothetical protein U0168_28615 [Nannocystaceae bacterium]